jgi:hypothetical protein
VLAAWSPLSCKESTDLYAMNPSDYAYFTYTDLAASIFDGRLRLLNQRLAKELLKLLDAQPLPQAKANNRPEECRQNDRWLKLFTHNSLLGCHKSKGCVNLTLIIDKVPKKLDK